MTGQELIDWIKENKLEDYDFYHWVEESRSYGGSELVKYFIADYDFTIHSDDGTVEIDNY